MHYHGDQWSWVPDSRFAASGMTAQQYPAQPLRRDGKLCDRAGNADRIVDRGGDRRADRIGAALAGEASLWERDAASTRATSPSSIEDPAFPSARRISPSLMSSEDAAACSSSAAARSAFSRSAVAAIRVASPVITVTREAKAP